MRLSEALFDFDQEFRATDPNPFYMPTTPEPMLIAGGTASEPQVIYLFDSNEGFESWARATRFAAAFAHIADIVKRTRARNDIEFEEDPKRPNTVQVISNSPIDREWAKLIIPPSKLESNATLFEDHRFAGKSMATGPCAIEDLSDVDFYKNISAIKVRGLCLLTDLKYFGGTHFYITGDPVVEVPDLTTWGFNRRAASAIVV